MTEAIAWEAYSVAHAAYLAAPTPERAAVVVDSFAAFASEFIPDAVAASEETELLRRRLQAAHA